MIELKLENMQHYPDNGEHQYIQTNLPFYITKGEDTFYWGKNLKFSNNREDWVVYVDEESASSSFIRFLGIDYIKQFELAEDAYNYAEWLYYKWLKSELDGLEE